MRARYTVVEALDRKDRVFRAIAESSDGEKQDVALVRLPPMRNQKFVDMFLADLRASLPLKHANIAAVLDITKTPRNSYFVVSEYVEGCDLWTVVAHRKRIATPHVLHVMIACCKALACAHSRGVIHRDLSPRTIVLSNSGDVKLVDFGLFRAKIAIEPEIVKGRFSYLSPEAGNGFDVDHQSNVFSAGIVTWELLAGRRLFFAESDYQTVELVRNARVMPIDGLDPELDAIVRKALAREPSERYQSATDLADALLQYAISRGIDVSADETGTLVREVRLEVARERSLEPVDPQLIADLQAEVRHMISIIDEDGEKPRG